MHCDHSSGLVTDLKDVVVVTISLGKAHALALTLEGKVFTLGINNKGQCGRGYTGSATTPAAATSTNSVLKEVLVTPSSTSSTPAGGPPHPQQPYVRTLSDGGGFHDQGDAEWIVN
jgi:hypothetical protein